MTMRPGSEFREARQQMKISQAEAGRRIGVPATTVSKWELHGQFPEVSFVLLHLAPSKPFYK